MDIGKTALMTLGSRWLRAAATAVGVTAKNQGLLVAGRKQHQCFVVGQQVLDVLEINGWGVTAQRSLGTRR